MTSKEALSTLNKYRNLHYNSVNEEEREIANALNVILPEYVKLEESDTPMKVIKDTVINGVCLAYKCPNCELEIDNSEYSKEQYYLIKGCISCLQRLDWRKKMSKSIYDEAIYNTQILLALVDVKQLNAKKKLDMLTQIEQALEQAQKQEKLLGLYKEINNKRKELITMARYNTWSWKLDIEIKEIQDKIKELE